MPGALLFLPGSSGGLLGLYHGDRVESAHIDQANLDMVLNNKVMFGSSSSNRTHFKRGAERMASIERKWPGIMRRMITRTVALDKLAECLSPGPEDIKIIVEMAP